MLIINLFDKNFAHSMLEDGFDTCTAGVKPSKIQWVRDGSVTSKITVFTDRYINSDEVEKAKSKIKIAWLIEPPSINPDIYQQIISQEDKFNFIFTFDKNLLKRSAKYRLVLAGGIWVGGKKGGGSFNIKQKTKLASIVSSNKTSCELHLERKQLATFLKSSARNVDVFGLGTWVPIVKTLDNYMYSIVFENTQMDNFFTEKILNCFATGTIPIYKGCLNIEKYFDSKGIIMIDDAVGCSSIEHNLDQILNNLNVNDYEDRLNAVQKNFDSCSKYISRDDMVATEIFSIIKSGEI